MKTKFKFYSIFAFFLSANFAAQTGRVGINTDQPLSTLDVNGDVRIREISPSTSDTDLVLVTGTDGIVKKRISENNESVGIVRAYLSDDFAAGPQIDPIYKIMNWNILDDPDNSFSQSTGDFTAPVTGLYRITMTLTAVSFNYAGDRNYIYGIVDGELDEWIMRFSIPDDYLETVEVISKEGLTTTFVGMAKLQQGKKYHFGISGNQKLLSKSTGNTGEGTASYFEIQLVTTRVP